MVILPAEAGEKHFDFEERVKLVNPRITAEGYKIGTRGSVSYTHLLCAISGTGFRKWGEEDDDETNNQRYDRDWFSGS